MTKELVISSNRHETKLAILEDDQLVEVFFQRANEYSLVGSIHKGRVTRVLPGMQSAFVQLGLERDAFLYVSDFMEQTGEDYERVSTSEERPPRRNEPRGEPRPAQIAVPVSQAPPAEAAQAQPSAEGAPASAAPAREGQDSRDGRGGGGDRRGRRGRRRRRGSRGGLPDSKYASPVEAAAATPESAQEFEEDNEPETSELEPLILPGESIAKYSGAAGADEEEEAAPELPRHEPEPTTQAETPVAAAHEVSDEPKHSHDEATAGQHPAPHAEPHEHAEPEEALRAEVRELVNEAAEEESEMERQAEAAQEAAEAALDAGGTPLEPHSHAGSEEEVEDEGEEEAEDLSAEGQPAGEGTEEKELAAGAEVREQPTARYIQRGPRRMRRRGGGGGGRSGGGERYEQVPRPAGEAQTVTAPEREPRERNERSERGDRRERPPLPSIADLLKEGQEIIVQIAKEPLGTKGARITSHVAMPGRYVVYMPTLDHLGVSRKVSSDEERQRLKRIVQTHTAGMTGGFIVRTAGEGKSEADLAADMSFLYNQWLDIRKKAEKRNAPCLLHSDLELVARTLRDQVNEQFKAIWVDNEELFETIVGFLERFQPALVNRVRLYTRDTPIFETFNVTAEMEKALRPKVWLKSGGYIVINQTEALVAIDINTGKFVGKSNSLEDTIVKTNLEAVKEIVRQVRLRDLGGIIVVDFIDMDQRKNRQKVMQALEEAMRVDRAPYKILQFNDFGLVAITRRRVKQSLERALCQPCPTCEGAGYVKSVQTVVSEILTEAQKIAPALEGKDVMLRVNPDVAKVIKSAGENYIAELEDILGRTLIVKSDPLLHPEKFDLA